MKRRIVFIVVACAALCIAFAIGRWSAPSPDVIVQEQAKEQATVASTATVRTTETATATSTTRAKSDEVKIVYRDRWYRADGTLDREREASASLATERITEQTAGHVQRIEDEQREEVRTVEREVVRRIEVEAEQPRWLVGGVAGIGLDGELVYGPQVHYRLIGPVHVSAAALVGQEPIGMVGVGISF